MIHVPKRITVHCSDSKNGVEYDIEKIRKFHTDPEPLGRGWSDIGYHIVIQPSGEVQNGRALNVVGAHVAQANTGNIGICLIGSTSFTGRQWNALRYQIDAIRMTYNIPAWEIYTHNQYESCIEQKKTCPNIPINRILAWYMEQDLKAVAPYLMY